MNDSYGKGAHTVHDIQYHFVWVTKFRYQILTRDIALRMRDLTRQTCEARNITILNGHVSKDHVHLHVSSPPGLAPSKIAQYIKGRSSRLIQQEFPLLRKRYWGRHLWARGSFCATIGKVTEKMIAAYIEQQDRPPSDDDFGVSDD
jgi:putative transposase